MKNQRGMAAVMTALMLFIGLVAVLYFWWGEYEQRVALTDDVEQLESSLKSRKRDLQDKTAKLDDEQSITFRLNQQLRKLSTDNKAIQSRLSEAEEAANTAQSKLSSADEQASELKASLDSANTEKEQAITEAIVNVKAEVEEEKSLLAAALEDAERKVLTVEKQLVDLTASLAKLTKDKEAAAAKAKQEGEKKVSLQAANKTLSDEMTTLKRALSDSQSAFAAEKVKSDQYQQQLKQASQLSSSEKAVLEKKNQALTDEKARVEKQVSNSSQERNAKDSLNVQPGSQIGASSAVNKSLL